MSTPTTTPNRTLIQQSTKLKVLHWVLFGFVVIELLQKIYTALILAEGSAAFGITFGIIVSALTVVVLIGLLLYKSWAYYILIFMVFQSLSKMSDASTIGLILTLIAYLALPIAILALLRNARNRMLVQATNERTMNNPPPIA